MLFFGWQGVALVIGISLAVVIIVYGFAKALD